MGSVGFGLARYKVTRYTQGLTRRGDGITMAATTTRAEHAAACDLPELPPGVKHLTPEFEAGGLAKLVSCRNGENTRNPTGRNGKPTLS